MTQQHVQNPVSGFAAQMARADFLTFARWHVQRSHPVQPTMAECVASLSAPEPSSFTPAAEMRDAA